MSEEYDEGYRRGYENGYEDAEENYCETIVELKARIAEIEAALRGLIDHHRGVWLSSKRTLFEMEMAPEVKAARAALDKTPEDWSHKNDGWR